jgi:alginate O-acetyltransferase complex protein AlgI
MATMVIGGLWHGANWNFVIWGALHGIALCIHKLFKTIAKNKKENGFKSFVSVLITYVFVCICWVPFRSTDTTKTFEILKRIFIWQDGILQISSWSLLAIFVLVVGTVAAVISSKKKAEKNVSGFYPMLKPEKFTSLLLLFLFIGIILGLAYTESNPFIYFQF